MLAPPSWTFGSRREKEISAQTQPRIQVGPFISDDYVPRRELKLSGPVEKYPVPGIKIFRYILPLASTFKSSDDAIVRTCL